jgi:hypothetical protein
LDRTNRPSTKSSKLKDSASGSANADSCPS